MKTLTPLKNFFYLPLAFCLGLTAQAQLLNETFDSAAGFSIADQNGDATFFSDGSNDYFGIYDGDGDGGANFGTATTNPSGIAGYTSTGDNYIAGEDLDGEGATDPFILTWSSLPSLSGETSLKISADFASTRMDADDGIKVSYRLDGGAWVEVLGIAGAAGTYNSFPYEITDFSAGTGDSSATQVNGTFTNVSSTIALAGTEATIEIKAEFETGNSSDNLAMDNLVLEELTGVQPPSGLSATAATSPDNKDSLTVTYTPDGSNDVLLVYSTVDTFGTPVDATTYSAGDSITGGGTVAGVFSSSPANITGLIPGTIYYVAAYSVDSSNSYSSVSSSTTGTTDSFAIQTTGFGEWTAVSVASGNDWSVTASSASASNYSGDVPGEDWLISPVLDLDASVGEVFEFTYASQYDDIEGFTGLEVFYTTSYTGDPSTTTWTPFTALNTELDDYVTSGSGEVSTAADLSSITGTTVSLAFKYTSSGTSGGSTRNWTVSDPLFSGNDASYPVITLSASPATVIEDASLAVTLTLPSNVSGDTDFYLTSNGDGSELSFPASVTVLDGTNSISFNVEGLTDSSLDGDQAVGLSANAADYSLGTLDITVTDSDVPTSSSDIIFTQYYEGASNNKWVEISNIGDSTVDLSTYQVTIWSNSNAEAWKADGAGSLDANYSLDLTGVSLDAGQSYLIANPSAALPYSSSLADATSSITYFNGNDSLVLYTDPTGYLTSNISDAIAFTNSGFEGSNKGFVRSQAYVGYDLNSGSSIEDFDDDNSGPAVWTEITTATADEAVFGDDAYIGTTALATPPSQVSFATAAQTVAESDGNIDLSIQVASLISGTLTVQVDFNADNSTADLTDITYSAPQQLTFDASSLVNPQTITIPIVDDGLDGGTEIASFDLSVISGTSILAAPSTHNVSITDDDFIIPDIYISEIADPDDNAGDGRYVELHNSTDSDVDLAAGNWNLVIYYNANTNGTNVALTGTIPAGGTYVIAQDAANFSSVYGVSEDQGSGSLNSNGDDNFELRYGGGQSAGLLVDVYGSPGTDGTGTDSEFEDGRAIRNADITSGNTTFTPSEWTIYSDDNENPNGIANFADMTPGVHPDPLVDPATGVSASVVSDTEISISFTAVDSNDVIIVFDTDGTFTDPTGDAPSVGDSFAGGTVIYVGQVSPFAHTGLTGSTPYFYSVISVNGTDYSSAVETTATTLVAGLIDLEDFEGTPGWTTETVTGDDVFEIVSDPGTNSAKVDGSSNSGADNIYLVSPAFDFSGKTDGVISFDFSGGYDDGNADSFELVYSTDYSGSGNPEISATWTEITYDFSTNLQTDDPTGLTASGDVSLPAALDGVSTFYLAFRYTSDGELTGSEFWYLDNILVRASDAVTTDPVADYLTTRSLTSDDLGTDTNENGFTVLEEYLAGFGDGSGSDTISYGIVKGATAALTLTSDSETEPAGIVVVLEATNDLANAFSPVAFTASVVDNGDGTFTRSYAESAPHGDAQRFLRLSITVE